MKRNVMGLQKIIIYVRLRRQIFLIREQQYRSDNGVSDMKVLEGIHPVITGLHRFNFPPKGSNYM